MITRNRLNRKFRRNKVEKPVVSAFDVQRAVSAMTQPRRNRI